MGRGGCYLTPSVGLFRATGLFYFTSYQLSNKASLLTISQLTRLVLVIGCSSAAIDKNIADIKGNAAKYEGKTITPSGEYQGWGAEYGPPPVTRSDWVIRDESDWIDATGRMPNLDAIRHVGTQMEVTGEVAKNKQVYIKAETIKTR